MSSLPPQQQQQQQQQRKNNNKKERIQQDLQRRLGEYVSTYPISISFPAAVASSLSTVLSSSSSSSSEQDGGDEEKVDNTKQASSLRTNASFVQHRLAESGILFDVHPQQYTEEEEEEVVGEERSSYYQSMGDITESISSFIADMNSTGCYDSVRVVIQPDPNSTPSQQQKQTKQPSQQCKLQVLLKEKKWYNLYAGGGFKHESPTSESSSAASTIPKIQFETKAGLINISGYTDTTFLNYTIDQTSSTTWSLIHDRPLYSVFSGNKKREDVEDFILSDVEMLNGSKMNLQVRGVVDTTDFEFTRSYKEFQRLLGVRVSNVRNALGAETPFKYLDYTLTHRDLLPRRHSTIPYMCDASPEILSQCNDQSYKHSLQYSVNANNVYCDDTFNPTSGYDYKYSVEVAGPPGDVGFVKVNGGCALHVPLVVVSSASSKNRRKENGLVRELCSGMSFHGFLNGGYIRPVTYGGLCSPVTNVADRFFVGGPMQLRGFLPAGIGPRAKTGGSSTPGGDAMGGDFYYTATAAASIPFPGIPFLKKNGVRLMGFANAGTLTSLMSYSGSSNDIQSILNSTRVAVGGGITMGLGVGGGRLEATYAIPIRYGPRDARKNAQFGLGFNIG